jgi:hypothetical protein
MLMILHPLDDVARHVEERVEVGVDDGRPLLHRHLVERRVARDAGVVDEHVHRPQLGRDLVHPRLAGLEIRHVTFVDVDSRLLLELGGGLVVAAVDRGDHEAGLFQPFRDRRADPPGATRYNRDTRHETLPWLNSKKVRL